MEQGFLWFPRFSVGTESGRSASLSLQFLHNQVGGSGE